MFGFTRMVLVRISKYLQGHCHDYEMKKKIAILGSTGSIGKTSLNIFKKNLKEFNFNLLSANSNYTSINSQPHLIFVN